jgi:hypothetical protein
VKYAPGDGTWLVVGNAKGLREVRQAFGEAEYSEQKKAIRLFLCEYFSTGNCNNELGSTISPIGGSPKGGKVLKVRWVLPGSGKSGGLRIIAVVYCDKKCVCIAEAFYRREDPTEREIEVAVKNL